MNPAFWQGRKVFVTGHTGFKGSWLCLLLERLGADVYGYSLPAPTEPSLYDLAKVGQRVRNTEGDVRDLAKVTEALKASRADVVLHMAAQPLVRASYADPVATYATNVMGTVNVLEAIRNVGGVRGVVVVTTDKCYENREWVWGYRENEAMGGHDPYSSSKGCAELVTSAYRRSFFDASGYGTRGGVNTAVASARAGNVIGGGDWAKDRLIPDMATAFANGQTVVIRNPESIRPWQFVLEPVVGYLQLAERLVEDGKPFADAWNFGPSDEDARPVGWIVQRMVELWGAGAKWERAQGAQPHEAHYLKLDTSKARTDLGWRPRTDLGLALEWIVEWYKGWKAGVDVRKLTERQVEQFLKLGR